MNAFLVAAGVLMAGGLLPCLLLSLRGSPLERLFGLELGGVVTTTVLLLLAQGYARSSYVDLALVLALLSFTGSLVYVRILGRRQ